MDGDKERRNLDIFSQRERGLRLREAAFLVHGVENGRLAGWQGWGASAGNVHSKMERWGMEKVSTQYRVAQILRNVRMLKRVGTR